MAVATALALGTAAASGIAGAMGSRAQTKAAKRARDLERGYGEESQAELTPWRESGTRALGEWEKRLFEGPGEIGEDPGYQFELSEGIKARERGASARGTLGSGAHAKALTRFGQNLASTRYGEFLGRYRARLGDFGQMAGVGQRATEVGVGLRERLGQRLGGYEQDIGAARASGYANIANAMGGGMQDILSLPKQTAPNLNPYGRQGPL